MNNIDLKNLNQEMNPIIKKSKTICSNSNKYHHVKLKGNCYNNLKFEINTDKNELLDCINIECIFSGIYLINLSLNLCILLSRKKKFNYKIPFSVYNLLYYDLNNTSIEINIWNNKIDSFNIICNEINKKNYNLLKKGPQISVIRNLFKFGDIINLKSRFMKIIGIIFELRLKNLEEINPLEKIDRIIITSDTKEKRIFVDDLGDIKKKLINRSYFLIIYFDNNYDNIRHVFENKTQAKGIECSSIEIKMKVHGISSNVHNNLLAYTFLSYS